MPVVIQLGPARLLPAPVWTGVPSPQFVQGQGGSYSVTPFVQAYNASTDVFGVRSGTIPAWCPFNTATGTFNATAAQTTFGPIVLFVTRSGMSTDSAPFSVTVTPNQGTIAGQWQEIPGTALRDAWLGPLGQPASVLNFGSGPSAILSAWNSCCIDTVRKKVVFPRGGGHGDWAGNQVVSFNLITLAWELNQPFVNNMAGNSPWPTKLPFVVGQILSPVYADDSPSSMHTYNSVEYIPEIDRVISLGGVWWSPTGESIPREKEWNGTALVETTRPATLCYHWNPNAAPSPSAWEKKAVVPHPDANMTALARQIVYDPIAHTVWYRKQSRIYTYDAAADTAVGPAPYTWDQTRTIINVPLEAGAYSRATVCLDVNGRKLYTVYPDSTTGRAAYRVGITMLDVGLAGADEVHLGVADVDVHNPANPNPNVAIEGLGALFDEDSGKIILIGFNGTVGGIYAATPAVGFTWELIAPSAGPSPPAPAYQGIYKKFFFYDHSYWWIHNDWTKNVWRFTPDTGPSTTFPTSWTTVEKTWVIEKQAMADIPVGGDITQYVFQDGKHHRFAYRPATDTWIHFRADSQSWYGYLTVTAPAYSPQFMSVWEIDAKTEAAKVIYPFGGYVGDMVPMFEDSGAFCWDSTRDCGWILAGNTQNAAGTMNAGLANPAPAGPGTASSASWGLHKLSFYGGRWHWDRVTARVDLIGYGTTINTANFGKSNSCVYDPVLDSVWMMGNGQLWRINLSNMTLYLPTITRIDTVPNYGGYLPGPYWGQEEAMYACMDTTRRKFYLLDSLSAGAQYGGVDANPSTPQGRKGAVIWSIDVSGITAAPTVSQAVQVSIFYNLPEPYRRAVLNEGSQFSNWYHFAFDSPIQYWPRYDAIVVPLPVQRDITGSGIYDSSGPLTHVFKPGEPGFTPLTEPPNKVISCATGQEIGSIPFPNFGGNSMRTGFMFWSNTQNKVIAGWRNTATTTGRFRYWVHTGV